MSLLGYTWQQQPFYSQQLQQLPSSEKQKKGSEYVRTLRCTHVNGHTTNNKFSCHKDKVKCGTLEDYGSRFKEQQIIKEGGELSNLLLLVQSQILVELL